MPVANDTAQLDGILGGKSPLDDILFGAEKPDQLDNILFSQPPKEPFVPSEKPSFIKDVVSGTVKELGRDVVGAGEAAASMAGSFLEFLNPIPGLGGVARTFTTMNPEEGAKTIKALQEAMHPFIVYEPKTPEGQKAKQVLEYPFQLLAQAGEYGGVKTQEAVTPVLGETAGNVAAATVDSLIQLSPFLLAPINRIVRNKLNRGEPLTPKEQFDFEENLKETSQKYQESAPASEAGTTAKTYGEDFTTAKEGMGPRPDEVRARLETQQATPEALPSESSVKLDAILSGTEKPTAPEAPQTIIQKTPEGQQVPAAAKEPWQMTRDEWKNLPDEQIPGLDISELPQDIKNNIISKTRIEIKAGTGNTDADIMADIRDKDVRFRPNGEEISLNHKRNVINALSEGKPVPPEVLADYPDLAKKLESGRVGEIPIVSDMLKVGAESIKELRLRISDVRFGPIEGEPLKQTILFKFDGRLHKAPLEGKFSDAVIGIHPEADVKLAGRLLLDRKAKIVEGSTEPEIAKGTKATPKPTGKRIKGEGAEYSGEYVRQKPLRLDSIVKDGRKNFYFKEGYWSDGAALVKMDKPVMKTDFFSGKQPDYKQVIPKQKGDPAKILGVIKGKEQKNPYVVIEAKEGETILLDVNYVDLILAHHPKAIPHIIDTRSPVVFMADNKLVGLVMPMSEKTIERYSGLIDNLRTAKVEPEIAKGVKATTNLTPAEAEVYSETASGAFADMGGYASDNPSLIEMPELVGMARDLAGGKYPEIKQRLGDALGKFKHPSGKILLRADIFNEPGLAEKVLAHEVGHMVDWLPDETMKRGNILGRIASLKKFMKSTYESLAGKKEIITELKALTQTWKPFDEKRDPKFTKYRYSSVELYADAISVLFNDPSLLKLKAPEFYRGFFDYMDRKPEVQRVYQEVQDLMKSGRENILAERQKRITDMFAKGEQKQKELAKEERMTAGGILESLNRELVDTNESIIRHVKDLRKRGIKVASEDNPQYWTEELPYVSSQVKQYLRDINELVKRPSNRSGITDSDLGVYMKLRREVTERESFANPLGMTKQAALDQLDFLKTREWGEAKYADVERFVNQYHTLRQEHIIPFVEKAGLYDAKLNELLKDNENYATFQVQDYLENQYGRGMAGKIYKQVGTLKEITNPFTATIFKDAALLRAANRKIAAQKTVEMLQTHFSSEIKPADTKWNGKYREPIEPKDPKQGMIVYSNQGKIEAYYVDKYIADSFAKDPYEAGVILRTVQAITAPIKDILVSKNPWFTVSNLQRDIRGSALKLPGMNLIKAIKYELKAIPDAYKDVFKGQSTETVAEMYRNKELIVGRYYGAKQLTADLELDRLLQSFSESPKKYSDSVIAPFQILWNHLDKPGQFSERLTKIAGHKFLTETTDLSQKEIAHLVRTRAGSPDFKRAGHLVQLYNNIFLFSNAGKEGMRASLEAYKESPSVFTWKLVKYDIIPKLVMYGASIGLLGAAYKSMMDDIPEHDKTNYMTIPVGKTDDNKTVYFVMPHDFTGQVVAGVAWKTLSPNRDRDYQAMVDYMAGGLPYSGLNPMIGAAWDTIQYLSGKNPYDSWQGRLVIPDREFEAGGWYKGDIMLRQLANQLGSAGLIYRFPTHDIGQIKGELENIVGAPVIGPGLSRFLRVSNRGQQEQITDVTEKVRQRRAVESLEVEKAIVDHFKTAKEFGTKDSDMIFNKLLNEGKIATTTPQAFDEKYRSMMVLRNNIPYANAFLRAQSNEEKAAILLKLAEQSRGN